MVFAISGEDTFRSREYMNRCVAAFQAKHAAGGATVRFADGEESSQPFAHFVSQLSSVGLFSQKQLLVFDNFFDCATADDRDALEKVRTLPDATLIIYQKGKLPKSKLAAFLEAQEYSRVFPVLSVGELRTWVQERFRVLGAVIEPAAVQQFVTFVEPVRNDLWRISHEIEKLVAYAAGRTVIPTDLEILSSVHEEMTAFALIDALFAQDTSAAFVRSEALDFDELFPLLSLIAGQYRNIWMLKEYTRQHPDQQGSAAADLGLHPYVVKKLTPLSKEMLFAEIMQQSTLLREVDRALKTSRVPKEALFAWLVMKLTQ